MKPFSFFSATRLALLALLFLASCGRDENSNAEKGISSQPSVTVTNHTTDPFGDTEPFKEDVMKSTPVMSPGQSPKSTDSPENDDPFGDRKKMATAPVPPEASAEGSSVTASSMPSEPSSSANSANAVSRVQKERKSALPELYVAIDDGSLIVTGAIGSKIQHERILDTLAKEFPDLKLDAQFELDYDRSPVNWGGRVAYPFLTDFLKAVESPSLSYEEGIVTLRGRLKPGYSLQAVTEAAIDTFSDSNTRDLVNELRDAKGGTATKR